MKSPLTSATFIASLAFFAMLFGAANLIFPLMVGMRSGSHTGIGIASFLLSAIGIPLLGLLGMLLFDGDYHKFFGRLGAPADAITIFICMLVIGPMIGIPRLVSLAKTASTALVSWQPTLYTSLIFSCIFFAGVYIVTWQEKKLLRYLGILLGLPLLGGLIMVIVKGALSPRQPLQPLFEPTTIFKKKLLLGFGTLDLIATLFFCSLLLTILKQAIEHEIAINTRHLAWTGLKAGLISLFIISVLSIGLAYIGAYYGQGIFVKPGSTLTIIAFQLFGQHGALITGLLALLASFSTVTALCVVVAEYSQHVLFNNAISYTSALLITILASLPLSTFGINDVMRLTKGPLVAIGYPLLIAITLCNIAYKLFGLKAIKIPVVATGICATLGYIMTIA